MKASKRKATHLLSAAVIAGGVFACDGGGETVDDPIPPVTRDAGTKVEEPEPECISLEGLAGGYRFYSRSEHGDNPAICSYVSCDQSFSGWNGALHIDDDGTLRMALKFVNTYGSTSSLYVHIVGRLEILDCDTARLVNVYDYADGCWTMSRHIGSWGTDPEDIDQEHPTMRLRLIDLGGSLVMHHPLEWFGGKFPWQPDPYVSKYSVDTKYDDDFHATRCEPDAPGACQCDCLEVETTCNAGVLETCIPDNQHVTEDCDDVCARDGYGPATGCSGDQCLCEHAACTDADSSRLRCVRDEELQMCVLGRWVDRSCDDFCAMWGFYSSFGCEEDFCRCHPGRCDPTTSDYACFADYWLGHCSDAGWWEVWACDYICASNGFANSYGCGPEGCNCD